MKEAGRGFTFVCKGRKSGASAPRFPLNAGTAERKSQRTLLLQTKQNLHGCDPPGNVPLRIDDDLSRVLEDVARDPFAIDGVLGDAVLEGAVEADDLERALVDLLASVGDDADDDPSGGGGLEGGGGGGLEAGMGEEGRVGRGEDVLLPGAFTPGLALCATLEVLDVL